MSKKNRQKSWQVTIPITGSIFATVEAASEEEAIEKAMELPMTLNDVEEWEMHRVIFEGNVFYGSINRATAEEES